MPPVFLTDCRFLVSANSFHFASCYRALLGAPFYTFYMFLGRRSLGEGGYTAKTFSVHRRVHNHYTKRILNLTLNRKKFLRQENEALDKQNCGKTAAANPARYTFSTNFVLVRRSSLERRRKLCAEALHHPFSNMSSQPCIFHCPLR